MTPATATAAATRPVCAGGCGTVLSRYNTDRDGLCALCRRKAETEPAAETAADAIERLVAGILLTSDALRPGEPVDLALELAAYGIAADAWRIALAVRRVAARHGVVARGRRGKPGYRVTRWERRYRTVVGFGGVPVDRDELTGKWRRLLPEVLPQAGAYPEELPGQLSLLGSDGPTGEDTAEPER